jgi:DNA ligase-1
LDSIKQVVSFEKQVLQDKFEGVMLRHPMGKYKMGRSTLKEGILLKLKRFKDAEATIISVHELFHNGNEKEKNELGNAKRSSKKQGLVLAGKMGSLEVINDAGETFNIGTGFTDAMRCLMWKNAESLKGKIVKYKYFEVGSKNAPRFPTFLGFRDKDDI